MALGNTIQYTPFQETSFGYGAGEIASAHSTEFPNGTDIVKVVMNDVQGYHWDGTGHISTPSVGTAVSVYNSLDVLWTCRGERDDVDAVLAQLKLFPADYPQIRPYDASTNPQGWQVITLKDNDTTGIFGNTEEPSDTVPIPETRWFLSIYDENDILIDSYTQTFQPIQPQFGNQRPYWTVEPLPEDKSVSFSNVDLGTISHGSDTENVRLIAKAYDYGTTTLLSSGVVNTDGPGGIYVGSKKPSTPPTGTLFDITGSLQEIQAFMDTVRVSMSSSTPTFDLYMELSDGVVGSRLEKTFYQTRPLLASTFPAQSTNEDYDLEFDIGSFSLTNVNLFPEVDDFQITISLDTTAQSAVTAAYLSSSQLTIDGNGVIGANGTWSPPTYGSLLATLDDVRFELATDFNGSFTFDLDITAVSSTVGSSYTMATQTVTCTVAAVDEYSWSSPSNINWFEDTVVDFDSGLQITDNSFSGGATYTVTARAKDNDGNALNTGPNWSVTSYGSASVSGTGTVADPLIITGNRSSVNTALQNLRMTPDYDWVGSPAANGGFYFEYKVVRDNDGETTDFPNYTVSTPFNMGALVKELDIPSTINFVSDYTARRASDNNYMTMKDFTSGNFEITETYNLNYTLTIYYDEPYNFYINGALQTPVTYVDESYVEPDYFERYLTFTGTIAQVDSWLQSLTFIGSGNTSIYYVLDRDTKLNIDDGTITMNELTIPEFTGWTSTETTNEYSEPNTIYDSFNDENDFTVQRTMNITYSGDWNNLSIKGWNTNPTFVDKIAWSDSLKNYDMMSTANTFEPNQTVTVYRVSDVIFNSTAGTITFRNDDLDTIEIDNVGEYEELQVKLKISSVAPVDFYITSQYAPQHLITAATEHPNATEFDYDTPVHFAPYTVSDMSTSGSQFTAYYPTTAANQLWDANRFYNLDITPNQPGFNWFENDFHLNVDKYDCLFGVTGGAAAAARLTFYQTELTQSSGDLFGTLDNIEINVDNTNTIATATSSYATDVFDCLYDDNSDKFYALSGTSSATRWYLDRVDTSNTTDLNISNGSTSLIFNTSKTILGGAIGRLPNGEIYVVVANSTDSTFDVYHQNTGGTDNFGLQQSISKANWGGITPTNFNSYFTRYTGLGSFVQANINGWMMLGTFMYYWNTTTSTWDEYDSNELNTSINSSSDLVLRQALSENVVFKTGIANQDKRKWFRIGHPDYNSNDIYRASNDVYDTTYRIQGSKRTNVFILGNQAGTTSSRTRIFRFTK